MINFFIVGSGRCGSTMLRNILNTHPSVYVPEETHFIPTLYEMYGHTNNDIEEYFGVIDRICHAYGDSVLTPVLSEVGASKTDFIDFLKNTTLLYKDTSIFEFTNALFSFLKSKRSDSVHIMGEKTPGYGGYINILSEMYPCAKFIHIVRDGRDVALSMSDHLGFQKVVKHGADNWLRIAFNKYYDHDKGIVINNPTLEDYIKLWRLKIRKIDDALSYIPNPYIEIRYEDLISHPVPTLKTIMSFIGMGDVEWARCVQGIRPDNFNKVKDDVVYRKLTNIAKDVLERYEYAT